MVTDAAAPRSEASQTLDRGIRILESLAARGDFTGLTVTELNPDHTEPGSLVPFARALGESLAQRPPKRDR